MPSVTIKSIMLNVNMLTVFMPNVIMLNVVAPFIVSLKSLYNKNFGSVKQKCILETYKKFKTGKKIFECHYLSCQKVNSVCLFRAAPYRFTFVLHRDALLH